MWYLNGFTDLIFVNVNVKFSDEGSLDHQLMNPQGLSVISNSDTIVANSGHKLIKIFSPRGQFRRKFGGKSSLSSLFNH